ncbi:type 2 periplasmic-binding domain-containing protein, partial [Staphylococcus epidermidis]
AKNLPQTFTSNYPQFPKHNPPHITNLHPFNQSIHLLLSKPVHPTFNDTLSYLHYTKQNPNAKIKPIKPHPQQNKSPFAFSKKLHQKTIEKFNKPLEKI